MYDSLPLASFTCMQFFGQTLKFINSKLLTYQAHYFEVIWKFMDNCRYPGKHSSVKICLNHSTKLIVNLLKRTIYVFILAENYLAVVLNSVIQYSFIFIVY